MYIDDTGENQNIDAQGLGELGFGFSFPHFSLPSFIPRPPIPHIPTPAQMIRLNPLAAPLLLAQRLRARGLDPLSMAKKKRDFMMTHNYFALKQQKAAQAEAARMAVEQQRAQAQADADAQAQADADAAAQAQADADAAAQQRADISAPAPDYQYSAPEQSQDQRFTIQRDQVAEPGSVYSESVPESNPASLVDSQPMDVYASPSMMVDSGSDTAPDGQGETTMNGFAAVTSTNPEVDKWSGILTGLVGAWQQKKLVDMNIERLKAGQQPIDIGSSGVGVQATVNVDPQIKRMLFWGGMGVLALGGGALLMVSRRRGRG